MCKEGALRMLCELLHGLLAPEVVCHGVVLGVCEKGEYWEYALHLLREMLRGPLTSGVVRRGAICSACEKDEHWEGVPSLAVVDAPEIAHPHGGEPSCGHQRV